MSGVLLRSRFWWACAAMSLLMASCSTHRIFPETSDEKFADAMRLNFSVERDLLYSEPVTGVKLYGDVYRPLTEKESPGVIVVHGGGWNSRTRDDMESICEKLAGAGFVTFNISYRLAPQHVFPAAVEDVQAAIAWLRKNAGLFSIDRERLAVFGYSAGAHLALMAALSSPDEDAKVQAIVVGGAPVDLTNYSKSPLVRGFLGEEWALDSLLYRSASPLFLVSPETPPTFVYHGKADSIVEFSQSIKLASALSAAKVQHETFYRAWTGHLAMFYFDGAVVSRVSQFLRRHLRVSL